jgi:hypothetical protein
MLDASDGVGPDGFILPEMAAAGLTTMARRCANCGYADFRNAGKF